MQHRAAYGRSDTPRDPTSRRLARRLPLGLRDDGATGGRRAAKAACEGNGWRGKLSDFSILSMAGAGSPPAAHLVVRGNRAHRLHPAHGRRNSERSLAREALGDFPTRLLVVQAVVQLAVPIVLALENLRDRGMREAAHRQKTRLLHAIGGRARQSTELLAPHG